MLKLVAILVAAYLTITLLMFLTQRSLLYLPDRQAPNLDAIAALGLAQWPSDTHPRGVVADARVCRYHRRAVPRQRGPGRRSARLRACIASRERQVDPCRIPGLTAADRESHRKRLSWRMPAPPSRWLPAHTRTIDSSSPASHSGPGLQQQPSATLMRLRAPSTDCC